MKTHRQQYPEQYNHALCGKNVNVVTHAGSQATGIVERVVTTRFGPLAILEGIDETAWAISDCKVLR